jgi:N utilization substance protein B
MQPEEIPLEPPSSSGHGAPHKNTRREAREMVLRMLFQIDIGNQPVDEVVASSLDQSVLEGPNREFAEQIVRGTLANLRAIDDQLRRLTQDWALDRQAAVDRNILRLTAYEILYCPTTPVAAVINEAIEMAKKYSTADSGRFVNGVLGALARGVSRGDGLVDEDVTSEIPAELPISDESEGIE